MRTVRGQLPLIKCLQRVGLNRRTGKVSGRRRLAAWWIFLCFREQKRIQSCQDLLILLCWPASLSSVCVSEFSDHSSVCSLMMTDPETDPVPCDFVYNVCDSRKCPPEDRVRDSTWSDRADWLLWVVVSMFTQHTKDPIWDCEETQTQCQCLA